MRKTLEMSPNSISNIFSRDLTTGMRGRIQSQFDFAPASLEEHDACLALLGGLKLVLSTMGMCGASVLIPHFKHTQRSAQDHWSKTLLFGYIFTTAY